MASNSSTDIDGTTSRVNFNINDNPLSPTSTMIEAVKHLSIKMEEERKQYEQLLNMAKENSKFKFDNSKSKQSNTNSTKPTNFPSDDSKEFDEEGITTTNGLSDDFINKFYQTPSKDEELTIGLISHDKMKPLLIEFCDKNKDVLSNYRLIATGTTGTKIGEQTGLKIDKKNSGPKGGDIEIANEIVNKGNKKIIAIIFLVDPMWSAPHINDIHALSRLCNLYNIPYATNIATAQILMKNIKYSNSR